MTQYRNPLQESVARAEGLLDHIGHVCDQYELAIEQRRVALDAYQEAKESYEQMESETVVDIMFEDARYSAAKNAEARKAVLDVCLIEARTKGRLANAWRAMNQAKSVLDNAEMAYAQMDARFKAVRVAAELSAGMLRASALV